MNKFKVFFKSILIPVLVGGLVGLIMSGSIDYNSLIQPKFAPPSFLFPIVWTILFILMGISYGILEINNKTSQKIKRIYYSQLFVNALWSIFFFVFKWRLFAAFWILLLLILIIKMIIDFYKENKISGLLQIPYLLWTIFATYLNWSIYFLNR